MYTFAVVVDALRRLHSLPLEAETAFRARIQNFQRVGLTPVKPGKGKRIDYDRSDAFLWALALEFSEFGIEPAILKRFIDSRDVWPNLRSEIQAGSVKSEYLIFYPHLLLADNALKGDIPCFPVDNLEDLIQRISNPPGQEGGLFDRRFGVIHIALIWRLMVQALEQPDVNP
jgi:hypothetical protein